MSPVDVRQVGFGHGVFRRYTAPRARSNIPESKRSLRPSDLSTAARRLAGLPLVDADDRLNDLLLKYCDAALAGSRGDGSQPHAVARRAGCQCKATPASSSSRRGVHGRAGVAAVAIIERCGAVAVLNRGAVEAAVAIGEAGGVAARHR